MGKIFWVFILLVIFSCSKKKDIGPPTPLLPLPSEAQLAWHEMETNAFIHFTTNTFTDKEWGYGDEKPAIFNPTELNVEQWITTLKTAGFKGVILTTKHHDGFCLWPSSYTEHSVKNSPYRGDIVKEVSEACKKHGLKFGIYLSPWDRNRADYGSPSYVEYYRSQLNELFEQYGPVFEMWFDGANGGDGYYGGAKKKRRIDGRTYYDWPGTLQALKELEPEVLFFSDAGPGVRWVGNEKGIAGETNWNSITPDTLYAGKPHIEKLLNSGSENGTQWIPAEVDVSIRPGWFYHAAEDSLVKTPEKLFEIYLTSVGRGSTLLLNVPPDRRGLIHEKDAEVLLQWRKLIEKEFGTNLIRGATAEAEHYRGNSEVYSAEKAIDDNPDTYWATDDGVTSAEMEITLPADKRIKYIVLQEYIRLGQRVRDFEVFGWRDGHWKLIGDGTTIGYKRILKIQPVITDRIKVTIKGSKACPLISNIELY